MLKISKKIGFFLLAAANLLAQETATNQSLSPMPAAPQVRIKDLARIEGLRDNQLTGLGLVVGLNGQGDSSSNAALMEMLSSLMSNLGAQVRPEDLRSKNAAVVAITATVPAFTRSGDALDIQIASLGDAKSLSGGLLLQTPLRAADGLVYAAAQGRVLAPTGRGAVSTSGTIPRGAILERSIPLPEIQSEIVFLLHRPDFSTAQKIVEALRQSFADATVTVQDAGRVVWRLGAGDRIASIAQAENLMVSADSVARVVVNRQTGVVVMGQNVRLGAATVSVRGAKISIGDRRASEQGRIQSTTSVEDLVSLLQSLGLSTDIIIDVLEALSRAGALFGTLEVL